MQPEEKDNITPRYYKRVLDVSFLLFLAIIIVNRILILVHVNIPAIDSDQPFMWTAVKDYAAGHFYEPRYYGQDYNTFMEALFAVPLYWLSVPVYYALPIATHFLALFPFLFTACYLFFKGRKENALLVLAVLLCLPTGYDIMNSIPRGFVTGLFFSSFFILSIFQPKNTKYIVVNTCMAVVGYFVNPNSVVASVPLLFFIFLHNYRHRNYYLVTALSLLSALPAYIALDLFYRIHPDYVIVELKNNLTTKHVVNILSSLDKHFAHISFFAEEKSIGLLGVLALFAVWLYRRNKIGFYSLLALLGLVLFSFFTGKVMDGVLWPYYSFSRMFLGIPLYIAVLSAAEWVRSKYVVTALVVLVLVYSAVKFSSFKKSVAYHTTIQSHWNGVHLIPLSDIMQLAEFFKKACEKNNTNRLLISNTFFACTFLNYGGPVIMKDFPLCEETSSERRYAVREANKDKVFDRFVFVSIFYNFDKEVEGKYGFKIKRLDDYGLFLIENNTMKNKDFIALTRRLEAPSR